MLSNIKHIKCYQNYDYPLHYLIKKENKPTIIPSFECYHVDKTVYFIFNFDTQITLYLSIVCLNIFRQHIWTIFDKNTHTFERNTVETNVREKIFSFFFTHNYFLLGENSHK